MPNDGSPKWPDNFGDYLSNQSNIQDIFEGDLLLRTPSTTMFQIVYEFMLHSKVIFIEYDGSRRHLLSRSPSTKGLRSVV